MSAPALERLRRLRHQAGGGPPPAAASTVAAAEVAAPTPIGIEQLRNLQRPRRLPTPVHAEEHHLPGRAIAPGLRLIEQRLPWPAPPTRHLQFPHRGLAEVDPQRLLAIDTETTGLAGGTGTRAFVIGIAGWERDGVWLRQWLLSRLVGEAAMLAALAAVLATAPVLLSYNGKSFDLPLLRTRWRLARQADASVGLAHLDLLHEVRRRYRGCWDNCRLLSAERHLLAVARDDDLPGSEAPAAFSDWLRHGRSGNLQRVIEHNRQDLLSLLGLAARLGATA